MTNFLINFIIIEGARMRETGYRCVECLSGIKPHGIDGENVKCEHGHETPRRAAELMGHLIFDIGCQEMSAHILRYIGDCIEVNPAKEIITGTGKISTDAAKILRSLKMVDPEKVVSREEINAAGVEAVKLIIEAKRRKVSQVLGIELDSNAAAMITAYLYYAKEGKLASMVLQTIKSDGFTLREPVNSGGDELVYVREGDDSLIIAAGQAEIDLISVIQRIGVARITNVKSPQLAIIYRTGYWETSKLFLYF